MVLGAPATTSSPREPKGAGERIEGVKCVLTSSFREARQPPSASLSLMRTQSWAAGEAGKCRFLGRCATLFFSLSKPGFYTKEEGKNGGRQRTVLCHRMETDTKPV